jgi:hypothetical protein
MVEFISVIMFLFDNVLLIISVLVVEPGVVELVV